MVAQAKKTIREKILKQRDALSEDDHTAMGKSIEKKLFSIERVKEAKVIAFYLHKGSEVHTENMIKKALKLGKQVVVPVTVDRHIEFYKFISFEDLQKGKYDILEPKTKIKLTDNPDIIVVPGITFGLCMHRIGYGKGYYDQYLGTSPGYRIGICYDFQLIEKLPKHENDQRMDLIVTEKRIII
ncbi:5-formyltetrahydrofolate cyclo-ligase [Candidatus Micrarchaeota archaeon]|nr:5-formyltetrahydrofolate cyclo-ligase [Candidatus Micrarchaeota archaeon]MBU1166340.1 5-formyltetrahydrofolate cyclo-ligase [Candidatus Micrarchaeota archaeon]MBU1886408.1 5-formyltetrahydrofolate cyclo-ligase [Candidatus Micrarchaeota archaeon]